MTWTHPDLWAGDVSSADLDPGEEVRTTLLASQAPGGGPDPAVSAGSPHSRPSAASGALSSWQQAELSARDWMRRNGYSDAQVTTGGADGGIDVTSSRAIAQVKHQRKPVGAAKIRELKGTAAYATHQGRSVLFFATYGYSPQAIAAGADLGVQLYQFDGSTWRRAV
ncbi:restriction endonuclease [Kocuria oceani]|uniref:restriction endonuclease n=1 Tax=Kocuria oceani TaxID=988827 RepID=UPI004035AF68